MKTSIRTFTIITVITLTLSGLSFSNDFPTTMTTTTPSGRTATTTIIDNAVQGSTTATSSRNRSAVSAIPEQPVRRNGESDEAFTNRMRVWEAELRRITEASQATTVSSSTIPAPPVQRSGEADAAYQSRLRAWETQVRQLSAASQPAVPVDVPSFPDQPARRRAESEAAYQARLRAWEAQVRSIASNAQNGIPKPEQRTGESDQAFKERLRAWEAEVRKITNSTTSRATTSNSSEIEKLQAQIQALKMLTDFRTNTANVTVSDNILIIPTEEMKTENLSIINEDMRIMSRILLKELLNQEIILPASSSSSLGGLFTSNYETNSGLAADMLNSMYLQGYGALFQMKANFDFPLSTPPEIQEKQEQTKNEGVDDVWQQTKDQIYEPQGASTNSFGSIDPKYNMQRVENLKNSFLKILKYASNIRALQPDESVILRISEVKPFRNSVKAIVGDHYFVQTGNEINWVRNGGSWVLKEDLPDNIKNLPDDMKLLPLPLNAIVIRAKKSDIDAFAKGELDFVKFREKAQVFSYPILGGNSGN